MYLDAVVVEYLVVSLHVELLHVALEVQPAHLNTKNRERGIKEFNHASTTLIVFAS